MLTPSQQTALDQTRHLSVTANAGSGKTLVLVERYLALLVEGGAEANEILALTYTEKAASELKRKIADRVSSLRRNSGDGALSRRLDAVREQLPGAFIGTLHSFCARMLREHPVEAGVDAAFRVVEGLDQHIMLMEAMKEGFSAVLGGKVGSREDFSEVVRRIGKRDTIETVRRLVQKRELLDRFIGPDGLYTQDDETILGIWSSSIRAYIESRLCDPQIQEDLKRVLGVADGRGAPLLRETMERMRDLPECTSRAESLRGIMDSLLTEKGDLRRAVATAPAEERVLDEVRRLAEARRSIRGMTGALLGSEKRERHGELLRLSRTLLGVTQIVIEYYELRKIESAFLDFDDLQLKTRALLEREPVRQYLAGRFKYVMVDEYQDTNQLQYDILRPLVSDLSTGNLFIVGDPKQSIYGFRNADVAVFERTRSDILTAAGPASGVVLEESFRLLRDLAAFVNILFTRLMRGPGSALQLGLDAEEVSYQPLISARANDDPGRVEILLGEPDVEEHPLAEGERIARRIRLLVSSGSHVFGPDEQPRPVSFRDIAILLRSRTFLPALESACVRTGIPYVVSGGIGYFQTQDVLDYFNYLQFLLDPDDDIALAGVLRSPFYAVSDVELFEATISGRKGSLWTVLKHGDNRSPVVAGAVRTLQDDLVRCPRMPSSEIISHLSHARLYGAKSAGTRRGPQIIANIEKLQRMARDYELQGFTTLYDFVRRLKRLIDEEDEEGQGAIESQTDAVQIMTVHAAKGLEFPLVIVPHLHRKFRSDTQPFIHRRLGVVFDFRDDSGEVIEPEIVRLAHEENVRRSEAEEKRIFYVACTRARDMLILSGEVDRRRSDASWMRWLRDVLGWKEGEAIPSEVVLPCVTVTLRSDGGAYERRSEAHELHVPVIREGRGLPSIAPEAQAARAEDIPVQFRISPLSGRSRGEVYSATRIKTFRECPSLYYLRYVLGLRGESILHAQRAPEETEDLEFPGELRGRMFHNVMQRIDTLEQGRDALRREVLRNLRTEWMQGESQQAGLVEEVLDDVERVLDSALWRDAGHGEDVRTEFTISSTLGEDYLSGTMDRVYRDAAGVWNVLDYKTDRVDTASLPERADSYWPQLSFYALLVHRFFSVPQVRASLLFTAQAEHPITRVYGAEQLASIEEEIRRTIVLIKEGNFAPRHPPCPSCPFGPTECAIGRR